MPTTGPGDNAPQFTTKPADDGVREMVYNKISDQKEETFEPENEARALAIEAKVGPLDEFYKKKIKQGYALVHNPNFPESEGAYIKITNNLPFDPVYTTWLYVNAKGETKLDVDHQQHRKGIYSE